jgi:hypothetical protein
VQPGATEGHLAITESRAKFPGADWEICPSTSALRVFPTPSSRRVDLANIDDVRREMAKVYREMKEGKIQSQDGTRFVYVLAQIGKLIEASSLAHRIEALEFALGRRPKA